MPYHSCTLAVDIDLRRFPYRPLQVSPQVERRKRFRLSHRCTIAEIKDESARTKVSWEVDHFLVGDLPGIVFERFLVPAPFLPYCSVTAWVAARPTLPQASFMQDVLRHNAYSSAAGIYPFVS
jgi:hypothetical protein